MDFENFKTFLKSSRLHNEQIKNTKTRAVFFAQLKTT